MLVQKSETKRILHPFEIHPRQMPAHKYVGRCKLKNKDDFHTSSRSMSTEARKIDIDGGCDAIAYIQYTVCYVMYSDALLECDVMRFGSLSQFIHLGHVQIGRCFTISWFYE